MEDKKPLKTDRAYDVSSKMTFVDAAEYATQKMLASLRDYIEVNERGPARIMIRCKRYSPFISITRLNDELKDLGLTSRLDFSSNGDSGDLTFDLDTLADNYFQDILYKGEIFK